LIEKVTRMMKKRMKMRRRKRKRTTHWSRMNRNGMERKE